MSDIDTVRAIMTEVGPRDDGILAVLQTGETSWALRFEHVDIEVELDADARRLMLSTEIGTPSEERRLGIYETVLVYNLLWSDTGGVRMALTEAGGALVQMIDLHCSSVTTELMAIVAHNLNERTLLWRDFISDEEDGEPPPADPLDYSMIPV